eukprot:927203-Rhodomonas_salina.3
MAGVKAKKKTEDAPEVKGKEDKKRKAPEAGTKQAPAKRQSAREKKPVNYSEDAMVEVQQTAKPG